METFVQPPGSENWSDQVNPVFFLGMQFPRAFADRWHSSGFNEAT